MPLTDPDMSPCPRCCSHDVVRLVGATAYRFPIHNCQDCGHIWQPDAAADANDPPMSS